ncbi:unnamed protein product [Rhodiola kirilowii]
MFQASENSYPKRLSSFHVAWKKCSSGQAVPGILLSHSRKCFIGSSLFLVLVVLPRLSTPLSKLLMGTRPSQCDLI